MSVDMGLNGGASGAAAATTPTTGATSGNPAATSTTAQTAGVTMEAGTTAPATTGTTETTEWWATGLKDEATQAIAKAKGWKSADDALKSYGELEKMVNGKLEALAPKTAAEYEFKLPENAKDIGYDPKFADALKDWALKAKLPKEAAAAVHDQFVAYAADVNKAAAAEQARVLDERLNVSERELTKEWGSKENPAFGRSLEMARRAMDQLGLKADLVEAGVIVDGKIANANIIKALAKVGQSMFAEDASFGNPATMTSNPFDPKTIDLKAQGVIFKQDKLRAKMLIQALPPDVQQKHYSYMLSQM